MSGDRLPSLHNYARTKRIVKTDEFSSVFRLRPVLKTAHFVLYTRLNGMPQARLGVVVAKRFAPRAVTRNTVKRVMRELFRQASLPALDCIVRLSKPVNAKTGPATTAGLKTALRAELARLVSYLEVQGLAHAGPALTDAARLQARVEARAKLRAKRSAKSKAEPGSGPHSPSVASHPGKPELQS
ncbi:MAG: ribonuclease P protein component [Janthinobacterium lividum]